MKIYQKIAQLIQAITNCINSNNLEWKEKHEDALHDIAKNHLPSGSGVDGGTNIDIKNSNGKKIVLTFEFHHMNENGYYDGWTDHRAIITPSFSGFDINITGKNRNDIKDYLYDLFSTVLSENMPENNPVKVS